MFPADNGSRDPKFLVETWAYQEKRLGRSPQVISFFRKIIIQKIDLNSNFNIQLSLFCCFFINEQLFVLGLLTSEVHLFYLYGVGVNPSRVEDRKRVNTQKTTFIPFGLGEFWLKGQMDIQCTVYIIYHLSYIIYHISYIIYHISYIYILYHIYIFINPGSTLQRILEALLQNPSKSFIKFNIQGGPLPVMNGVITSINGRKQNG